MGKEETVVFVRDRVWVERTALGITSGQSKVVEAAQDEASPTKSARGTDASLPDSTHQRVSS